MTVDAGQSTNSLVTIGSQELLGLSVSFDRASTFMQAELKLLMTHAEKCLDHLERLDQHLMTIWRMVSDTETSVKSTESSVVSLLTLLQIDHY